MAAIIVVVLLAVVGGLVLLSQSDGGDVALTETQLQDALVTEADVGDGFTIDPGDGEDEDEDFVRDDLDASEECLDLYEQVEAADVVDVEANVQLEGGDGSQVEQTLEQGSDIGLDTVREFAETCGEVTLDDGENAGSISFEVVDDIVEVGDESLTLRVVVDFDEPFDITLPSLGVLWERDGTHASLNVTGPIDEETFETGDPDEDLLRDVVEAADTRLAEVIDEA
ncbi:MAG TPA: hypothetical protein VF228_16650 [Iamia sp.]